MPCLNCSFLPILSGRAALKPRLPYEPGEIHLVEQVLDILMAGHAVVLLLTFCELARD